MVWTVRVNVHQDFLAAIGGFVLLTSITLATVIGAPFGVVCGVLALRSGEPKFRYIAGIVTNALALWLPLGVAFDAIRSGA